MRMTWERAATVLTVAVLVLCVGGPSAHAAPVVLSNSPGDGSVEVSVDGFGANNTRLGSRLTQAYTFTNPSASAVSFELVRYLDGDLQFDQSITDGGGRLVLNGVETLFETDSATGTADPTTFVGISASGGT